MAHKYWRILILGNNGDGFTTSVTELQMYDSSGNLLTTGGTASANNAYTFPSSLPASNAFDGSNSTIWAAPGVASTGSPFWLQYTFAGPVDVATLRLSGVASGSQSPSVFKVQYSDNNSTWFDATGNLTYLYQLGAATSFTVALPLGGFYVNWRIRISGITSGGSVFRVAELLFKDTVGGGTIVPSSTYAISNAASPFHPAANAYDLLTTTYAECSDTTFIGYAFHKPYKVIEVDYTNDAPGGSYANTSPLTLYLEGSNDGGVTWTTVSFFVAAPWTGPSQTQVFGVTPNQRGNIAYNQIRANDRQGAGSQFSMFGGGTTAQGHVAIYDGNGNLIDAQAAPILYVGVPPSSSSIGLPGMVSFDNSGNFYYCYAFNLWGRITGTLSF